MGTNKQQFWNTTYTHISFGSSGGFVPMYCFEYCNLIIHNIYINHLYIYNYIYMLLCLHSGVLCDSFQNATAKGQSIKIVKLTNQKKAAQFPWSAPNMRHTLALPPFIAMVHAASTAKCWSCAEIAPCMLAFPWLSLCAFPMAATRMPCSTGCAWRDPQATAVATLISAWLIPDRRPEAKHDCSFKASSACSLVRFATMKAWTSIDGRTIPAMKSVIAADRRPQCINAARTCCWSCSMVQDRILSYAALPPFWYLVVHGAVFGTFCINCT